MMHFIGSRNHKNQQAERERERERELKTEKPHDPIRGKT